jgi:hypothetical protein
MEGKSQTSFFRITITINSCLKFVSFRFPRKREERKFERKKGEGDKIQSVK